MQFYKKRVDCLKNLKINYKMDDGAFQNVTNVPIHRRLHIIRHELGNIITSE